MAVVGEVEDVERTRPGPDGQEHIGAKAAVVGIAAAGAVALWLATRSGVVVTPDSATYFELAEEIRRGEFSSTHFPPGYPAALAAFVGVAPITAAHVLAVIAFGMNLVLSGVLAARLAGWRIAVAGVALLAVAPDVFEVHTSAISEPLFMAITMSALLLLLSGKPEGAGLLAGGAFLVRYVGAAVAVTGLVVMWRERRWRFAVAAAALPVLWLLRSAVAQGEATSRQVAWHPASADDLSAVFSTLHDWTGLPWPVGLVIVIATLVVGRTVLLWTFAATYVVVVLVTVFLLDAQTPLDSRQLLPLHFVFILSGCVAATRLRGRAAWAVAGVAGLIFVASVPALLDVADEAPSQGIAAPLWQESELLAAASEPCLEGIVSNGPDIISVNTECASSSVPRRYDQNSLADVRDEEIGDAREGTGGHVVWFDEISWREYLVPEEELVSLLDLELVQEFADGRLYRRR